ncbi:N-alpha-acetyltransferase 60 [Camelus dromedarius]|uniref:N-alpha-acetyltransferase 60 n=1 Tax=Camelus dromedarius TaxID=9838 RepID=A0A5N4BZ02_CAMDR|nr:N-alpha-acetyltransferase 60 [Camelus dromedarius]
MTEVVPSSALSEVSLRLLCHDDIDTVKHLCGDWFPIEYPDSWYRDITSNKKFFSLAATYRGAIVGMIVAEIKSRTKIHKEDGDILASSFSVDTQVAYILSLGVVKEFRKHGIGVRDCGFLAGPVRQLEPWLPSDGIGKAKLTVPGGVVGKPGQHVLGNVSLALDRIYRQAHSLLCSFLPWSSITTKGGIEYSRTM